MSYLDPSLLTTGTPGPAARVSPQGGMAYPVVALADPTGKLTTGVAVLCALPSAAYTAVPAAAAFSTQYISDCTLDATITTITGGTTPTVTLLFQRQGADGIWYPVTPAAGQSSAITYTLAQLPATVSLDIGLVTQSPPATGSNPYYGAFHNVFTPMSRVTWTTTGNPTSVTLSLSVTGR